MLYTGYGIQDRLWNIMFANASELFGLESWRNGNVQKLINQLNISSPVPKQVEGGGGGIERGGLVVESRTPEREVGGSIRTRGAVLFSWARRIYSSKALVIPRKQWLRPDMTEKLFIGVLS